MMTVLRVSQTSFEYWFERANYNDVYGITEEIWTLMGLDDIK